MWRFQPQILCCGARIAILVFLTDTAAMIAGAIFGKRAAGVEWREIIIIIIMTHIINETFSGNLC